MNDTKITENLTEKPSPKTDEQSGVYVDAFLTISDPDTREVFVEERV